MTRDDVLSRSWNAFTAERAADYFKGWGSQSGNSARILADVITSLPSGRDSSILDLGCGNAQLLAYLRTRGLTGSYLGVELSAPLLEAARRDHAADPRASFMDADVESLEGVPGGHDVAIYSHVLEMLGSPDRSLHAASRRAAVTIVRFFEPPDHDYDLVELREMEVGDGVTVPYLRRSMGRDVYRLLLGRMGATSVDVYVDEVSGDQVHVIHCAPA